jgi:ferric-dicitrate binding protein FerR (iron transport regulator)
MGDAELRATAIKWLAEVVFADELISVLPGLHTWLRENPAHRAAFARAQRTLRLTKPILGAAQPSAGCTEFKALLDALDEEIARSPKEFTNS